MMNSLPLSIFLVFAILLFAIGLIGALTKRNPIMVIISIELMLNAVNLNLISFAKDGVHPGMKGEAFATLVIFIAAAEAIVGLVILFVFYRNRVSDDRSAHPKPWQAYGSAFLVGLSAVLMIMAVTGGYFS